MHMNTYINNSSSDKKKNNQKKTNKQKIRTKRKKKKKKQKTKKKKNKRKKNKKKNKSAHFKMPVALFKHTVKTVSSGRSCKSIAVLFNIIIVFLVQR